MIGVVYSKRQKIRRRLIICDDGQMKCHMQNLHAGEGWLQIPDEIYKEFKTENDIDEYVAAKIGQRSSDRCVLVCPEGNVLSNLCADPEIDTHPNGRIFEHSRAETGWKYTDGNWHEPDVKILGKRVVIKPGVMAREDWEIAVEEDKLTIGCATYPISEWEKFTSAEVGLMAEKTRTIETAKWWEQKREIILSVARRYEKKE